MGGQFNGTRTKFRFFVDADFHKAHTLNPKPHTAPNPDSNAAPAPNPHPGLWLGHGQAQGYMISRCTCN